ncbi:MAG: glycosyltransferase [Bacteroidetes bacterium]|nr:glycosyltransferase [Bacteroidota bacterium]
MIVFAIIPLIYFLWLYTLVLSWKKTKLASDTQGGFKTKVSIVVAVRNEEQQIEQLCFQLLNQKYPNHLYEIIIVDDLSEDNTVRKLQAFPQIRVIENLGEGKKSAITTGVKHSEAELIVSTDADCEMSETWLQSIVSLYESTNAAMICGPVKLVHQDGEASFYKESLYQLQALEFHSLILMSAAYIKLKQPFTCNGANIAYRRDLFLKVNGYEGNSHIASGDDEFLMHKLKSNGSIEFIQSEEAIIKTQALSTYKDYFNQRIRWASKHKKYELNYQKSALALVALVHLFSIVMIFLDPSYMVYFLVYFGLKTLVEYKFINVIHRFYRLRTSAFYVAIFQLVYSFVVLFISFRAMFFGYEWKGRKIIKE